MLRSVEKLIREQGLIPRGSTVLCAVSGGADSICLLHILYRLRGRLGFTLAAAHYDHRLRGEESARDAAFVAQFVALCCGEERQPDGSRLPAVPVYIGSGDVAAEAERRGTGVEETARELRYAFLRETAEKTGADRIATAHTADDNVETILFHLARGSGLRGLSGIQPERDGLIRPLLLATRQEVEKYLFYYGLPHMEDRTNSDDAYARNRIRHQVLPVLEGLFPGFSARMGDTAARLREDEAYLEGQAALLTAQAEREEGRVSLPAALISQAPRPVAVRAVRQLIGAVRGGDQDCAAVHLESVIRLCGEEGSPSARADLPRGMTARREYGLLVLSREDPDVSREERPLALPGTAAAGEWEVVCTEERCGGRPQGPWEVWLDRERVPALTLRPRRAGDELELKGRPRKSVKKWMIEEKIPRQERDGLPVLDCGGAVAAAAGLGPDAAFLPGEGAPAWHILIKKLMTGKEEDGDV